MKKRLLIKYTLWAFEKFLSVGVVTHLVFTVRDNDGDDWLILYHPGKEIADFILQAYECDLLGAFSFKGQLFHKYSYVNITWRADKSKILRLSDFENLKETFCEAKGLGGSLQNPPGHD